MCVFGLAIFTLIGFQSFFVVALAFAFHLFCSLANTQKVNEPKPNVNHPSSPHFRIPVSLQGLSEFNNEIAPSLACEQFPIFNFPLSAFGVCPSG